MLSKMLVTEHSLKTPTVSFRYGVVISAHFLYLSCSTTFRRGILLFGRRIAKILQYGLRPSFAYVEYCFR